MAVLLLSPVSLLADPACAGGRAFPAPASACARDKHRGFQLYQSDPSGNYGGWKATAIGANHQAATNVLQGDYKEELTLEEVGCRGWWLGGAAFSGGYSCRCW